MCLDVPVAATDVAGNAGSGHSKQAIRDAQIASLTGMRGFAALLVVVVHTTGRTTDFHWFGIHGYGPIALFTLSGFLLYRPFAKWALGVGEQPSLSSFAIRRILRIFPAYWVVLHVWYFAYPAAVPNGFVEWVKDVTLVSTLQFFTLPKGLEQSWSMGTELSWYVALPFLAFVAHLLVIRVPVRHRVKAHVAILLTALPVSVVWGYWARTNTEYISDTMWLPAFLFCFSFGALVGLMMEAERAGLTDISRGRKILGDPWILPILALVFVVLATSEWAGPTNLSRPMTLSENFVRDFSATGLAGTLLVISVFGGPTSPIVRFLSSRWMQATGRWSYGIYLWHLPIILLLWEDVTFSQDLGGLLKWFILVVPISYVLGAASYAWVEQPAMSLAKVLTPGGSGGARKATVAPTAAPAPAPPAPVPADVPPAEPVGAEPQHRAE